MKNSEMMRIFEDDKTPFGTEFRYKIPCGDYFRAVKSEWNEGYSIKFFRNNEGINDLDAFITHSANWVLHDNIKELTIEDIEHKLGYKIKIIG